jgi:hypothetical protein
LRRSAAIDRRSPLPVLAIHWGQRNGCPNIGNEFGAVGLGGDGVQPSDRDTKLDPVRFEFLLLNFEMPRADKARKGTTAAESALAWGRILDRSL